MTLRRLSAACVMALATAGCGTPTPPAAGAPPTNAAAHEQAVRIPAEALMLSGVLFTPPAAPGRRPAIVLMHGCAGMRNARGDLSARDRDWAERFAAWGFVALMLDSFGPRGLRSICEMKDRPLQPWVERSADAHAALAYLAARADVDPGAVFVLGWSHGGSSVLGVVRPNAAGRRPGGPQFKAAIAFYPGCGAASRDRHYRSSMPLLVLQGAADDWTPAAPCIEMTERLKAGGAPVQMAVYPDAHHGFDQPGGAVRYLPEVFNPAAPGERGAHVGSDAAARRAAIGDVARFIEAQRRPRA